MRPTLARRLAAGAYGVLCHGTFVLALATMVRGLLSGMESGLGTLTGGAAFLADALLLLQFPLLHSFLLTSRGRRVLARLVPGDLGRTMATTSYALVAALQVGATFLLWSPSGVVLWRPEGLAWGLHLLLFAGAFLFLGKALLDAGLGLQTGWIGWTAAWRGRAPRYPGLPRAGLFARCRQPIYLGFALVLWTAPAWTPDRVAVALAWTAYCIVGPIHKERRFAATFGREFEEYRRRTPYLVPRIFS